MNDARRYTWRTRVMGSLVSGAFLLGLALPALALDLSRSGGDGLRLQALNLTPRASVPGTEVEKAAAGTTPFTLSGEVGLTTSRMRVGTTVWTTPVVLDVAIPDGDDSMWRFGAGTDGWTRVSDGEGASGLGDLQLSVTRTATFGREIESYASVFAVVPGSSTVGSPGSGWGVAAGVASPLSSGRHWLLADVSWSQLRLDPSVAARTGVGLAEVGLKLNLWSDHITAFTLGAERGGGVSTRLVRATHVVPVPLSPAVRPDLGFTWAGSHQNGHLDSAFAVDFRLAF